MMQIEIRLDNGAVMDLDFQDPKPLEQCNLDIKFAYDTKGGGAFYLKEAKMEVVK